MPLPPYIRKVSFACWRQPAALGCMAVILTGLFTFQQARILSGLGIAGLVVLAFSQRELGRKWKKAGLRKTVLAFGLVFLIHALTIFYTPPAYLPIWWQGLVLKLPLLLLPLPLALLAPWPARWLSLLYYFFFHLVFFAALYSLTQYFLHFSDINQSYHRAGVMPTLVNHVRFSLMVAFAIFIGIRLWWQGFYWRHHGERTWMVVMTLLLFVFLHLLAVRSGLLVLYLGLLAVLVYFLVSRKKYTIGAVLVLGLVLMPVLSYLFLPTFKEKLHYTQYDLAQRHDETNANNYSLTGRLYSYRVGLAVWAQRPLLGWGMGQLPQAIRQAYKTLLPGIQPAAYLIPHNQLLYYLGLLGIIGLLVFLGGFYYPFWAWFKETDPLFHLHYLILTCSFLVEATLETQVGLIYAIVFILLPLIVKQRSEEILREN